MVADAIEPGMEAADLHQKLLRHRHVGADQPFPPDVGNHPPRLSPIDDGERSRDLVGEPCRTALLPDRIDAPADGADRGGGGREAVADCCQPARQGDRIIVEEGDIAAGGRLPSGVAGNAKPDPFLAQVAKLGSGLELGCDVRRAIGRCIVDDDDLEIGARELLADDARYRLAQQIGAIARADDAGDRRPGAGHWASPPRRNLAPGQRWASGARDRRTIARAARAGSSTIVAR